MYALFKASFALITLTAICGTVVLSSIFLPSDGTEPRDVCIVVEGTQGLLPINPNEGGTIVYSCDIKWDLALFYIAIFGFPLSILCMPVILLVMRALVQRNRD